MMPSTDPVATVRRFNRFYTRAIGVIGKDHLGGPYSLAENRVLYEVASGQDITAKAIAETLGLDAGYLSRIVARLERDGLLARQRSAKDGRSAYLRLTPAGVAAFAQLNSRQAAQVESMIGPLSGDQRDRLAGALNEVEALLGVEPVAPPVLRAHRTGDMGWVMERHAVLYNREYGWGPLMEAHVAEIVGHFLKTFDPEREHCWIAEQGGARLGSAFVVNDGDGIARIRLVLLEPAARGWGLGRRLVEACIAFARERGYRGMVLWTHQKLTAARAIYASVGFELVDSEIHHDFGVPEVGETWRLAF